MKAELECDCFKSFQIQKHTLHTLFVCQLNFLLVPFSGKQARSSYFTSSNKWTTSWWIYGALFGPSLVQRSGRRVSFTGRERCVIDAGDKGGSVRRDEWGEWTYSIHPDGTEQTSSACLRLGSRTLGESPPDHRDDMEKQTYRGSADDDLHTEREGAHRRSRISMRVIHWQWSRLW